MIEYTLERNIEPDGMIRLVLWHKPGGDKEKVTPFEVYFSDQGYTDFVADLIAYMEVGQLENLFKFLEKH